MPEERLSSSLTTQQNRAPYGVQRGTTCSVWCFPIKKQKQTALQGKQPNPLNGIYQQLQGLNKNSSQHIFLPKSTKQSAWEKHCCIRSGQHLSKMNAQVLSPFQMPQIVFGRCFYTQMAPSQLLLLCLLGGSPSTYFLLALLLHPIYSKGNDKATAAPGKGQLLVQTKSWNIAIGKRNTIKAGLHFQKHLVFRSEKQ